MKCDDDKAGRLGHLVGQEKTATFEKMTQKEINTDDDGEEEDGEQQELPGTNGGGKTPTITPLLTKEKLDEAAAKKH